jgi:hypothetical protein
MIMNRLFFALVALALMKSFFHDSRIGWVTLGRVTQVNSCCAGFEDFFPKRLRYSNYIGISKAKYPTSVICSL